MRKWAEDWITGWGEMQNQGGFELEFNSTIEEIELVEVEEVTKCQFFPLENNEIEVEEVHFYTEITRCHDMSRHFHDMFCVILRNSAQHCATLRFPAHLHHVCAVYTA